MVVSVNCQQNLESPGRQDPDHACGVILITVVGVGRLWTLGGLLPGQGVLDYVQWWKGAEQQRSLSVSALRLWLLQAPMAMISLSLRDCTL